MSKQLGVGVRVFVGWTASQIIDDGVARGRVDPRLRAATIIDGPYQPGHISERGGRLFRIPTRAWGIIVDGDTWPFTCSEILLTPIDDDQESVTHLAELENAE